MPRTLKSYAGFFCPTSPVSSLLTANDAEDYHFYTRDNLTSVFDKYHRNTFELNLMCAWELVFGKHYHHLSEPLSNKTHFAKGALDYLIFPLIARGLGDCNMMLMSLAADNILIAVCLVYPILVITALIIALELTRLVLGIPLVLPTWGVIAAMRTFNSKTAESNEADIQEPFQINRMGPLCSDMGAFYSEYPDKRAAGEAVGQQLISLIPLADSSAVLAGIEKITPGIDSLFENTNDSTGVQKRFKDILKGAQNIASKEQVLEDKEVQIEARRLQWK